MAKPPKDSIERLHEELERNRHWAMCGKLVTGLVHEINNPLDGIINCIRMVRSGKMSAEREKEYLEMAEQELFRVTTLTKRLLGLSRENPLEFKKADLNELVEKSLFFIDYRMGVNHIALKRSLAARPTNASVDQTSILQVIVNLLLNAIESMPDGGELSVRTEADPQWVKVSVGDTGCGIPEENLGRIFQPFFTTKSGTSTGLGLAISQNVAEQHRGTITVESGVGKGSIFTLKLPRLNRSNRE
ncbi:MAG: ATP-binding protein [candidate division WOR-3 bacterium]|nr:ATP-binding protein [candidate division WOR-3 bacterium]